MAYQLKVDQYSAARGGTSEVIQVSCAACGAHLFDYQKDGPGFLYRGYFDRVLGPEPMVTRFQSDNSDAAFHCTCGACFGKPMVYTVDDENRPAIDFTIGGIVKQRLDGSEYEPSIEIVDPASS